MKICLVIGSLRTGGAERSTVNLANSFSSSHEVHLVLVDNTGGLLQSVSNGVKIFDMHSVRARNAVFAFRKYLHAERPDVVIAVQLHVQLMAFLAMRMLRKPPLLILNEQSTFSKNVASRGQRIAASFLFRSVDHITCVSEGARSDLVALYPYLKKKCTVIHNGIATDQVDVLKSEIVQHPFFAENVPVIISAGRLITSKGFNILIKSFSVLLKHTKAKLIILGDGEERFYLESLISGMNLNEHISLPGNVPNPLSYFFQSGNFVLSSRYEGLPAVLLEALSCQCRIVSTDCPYGPREILADGKYGMLVPVDDVNKLSEAMLKILHTEPDRTSLTGRARDFDIKHSAAQYLELITSLKRGKA